MLFSKFVLFFIINECQILITFKYIDNAFDTNIYKVNSYKFTDKLLGLPKSLPILLVLLIQLDELVEMSF